MKGMSLVQMERVVLVSMNSAIHIYLLNTNQSKIQYKWVSTLAIDNYVLLYEW